MLIICIALSPRGLFATFPVLICLSQEGLEGRQFHVAKTFPFASVGSTKKVFFVSVVVTLTVTVNKIVRNFILFLILATLTLKVRNFYWFEIQM